VLLYQVSLMEVEKGVLLRHKLNRMTSNNFYVSQLNALYVGETTADLRHVALYFIKM